MGIFDRDNGAAPSGRDLMYHDSMSGGGEGGISCSGCLIAVGIVLILLFIFAHVITR